LKDHERNYVNFGLFDSFSFEKKTEAGLPSLLVVQVEAAA